MKTFEDLNQSKLLGEISQLREVLNIMQRANVRPTTLRVFAYISIFTCGVVFLALSWLFNSLERDFFSGILSNLGCEFISSIIFLVAIELLAQLLQKQDNIERELYRQIERIENATFKALELPPCVDDEDTIQLKEVYHD
jgi:hypothetical protein